MLLIYLFQSGCQSCGWNYREVLSDCADFNSSQLKYCAESAFSGIEVQLLHGNFGILGFLNVGSREICSPSVMLLIDDISYTYEGVIMQGRQRLQLPYEAICLLVESLVADKCVAIFLEGFKTTVQPNKFQRLYREFATLKCSQID